ncbi:hypothetical protein LXL04_020295 [Taraxacum kok-saghyz]
MSSSRIRNFRRRSEDDDNEDEDKEKTTTPAATTTISKKQQSKPATATPKPKKPSLLSFADDESTDFITPITRSAFLIQLNNLVLPVYQNLQLSKERTSASSLPSNVQPQAGVYTKEALLELQKNTKTLGSSTSRSRPRPPPCEPIIVLKGMVKPIIDDSLTNTKEGDEESDRDETTNQLGSIRLGGKIGKGGNLDGGVIPDQAMIDAIRAKRERLRQSRGAALDFIALDEGSNHGEAEGLSDEEPEFQGRIALIGEKGDAKKGNDSDDGVEDEEDEEDKMWEEEQFRKGLGKRIDEGVAVRRVNSSTIPTIVQNVQQKVKYPTVPVSSYPSVNNGPSIGGSFGWSRFRYNINTSFAKTSVGSVYIVSRFLLPSSTATTATAAMSSNRIRNFRRRSEDDDNEDEDKEKTTTPAATTTISKKQQSKPATATPKPKKPSILSFADDESTDFITPITRSRPSNPIKQPSSSRLSKPSPLSSSSAHKLTSAKDRNSTKERTSASSLPSNVQPQAGVYTKEALLELQKNTKTLGSSTSRSRPRPPPCEPIIVLKGMVKPIIDDSLTNTKEGDEESDRDETMNRLGSIRLGGKIGKGGNLDGGMLPDQAMIDAIRAKRERLRQSRAAAPDFIALDGGSNHGEVEGLSDEEPEFQGIIALIGEKGDAKKGVFEDVVDVSNATFKKENVGNDSDDGVEDEEDEEDKMWEEEQFRKGLGKRIDEGVAVRGVSSSTIPTYRSKCSTKSFVSNCSSFLISLSSVYIVSRFLLPSSTPTTATAAMSSSRIRNFHRRSEDDDNENEDKEKTTTPAATTTISKKQQSKPATATPKPKRPSLLSFVDDESTDFITPITRSRPSNPIKQPSSSRLSKPSPLSSSSTHKLTSAKDRNSAKERTSASSLSSNVQPQAGVYTKEALLELQKNTKTLGSSTPRSRPRPPPCEPIIVLKGMVKPIIDDSLTNTKEGDEESDRDETMNRLGSIRLGGKIGKGGNLDGGVIPDQAMIDAIRAKRERLRQSRAAAPDFIALDEGSNHGEAEGLSDEEPEFQGRIALIGEKGDAKKGVFEDVVDVSNATFRKENVGNDSDDGVEDEEDEEDKMWEEEQFRKGLGKRIDEGVAVRGVSSSTIPTIVLNVQQKVAYPTVLVSSYPSVNNGPSIGGSFGWSRFRYNINTSFAKTSVGSVYIVSRFLLPSSTATTATTAMSRSRIRNFRRRSGDDDNEDEDKEKTTTPAATTTISKKQQSKPATATPKPKKPSLLSFADDESTDFITPITRSRPSNPFNNLPIIDDSLTNTKEGDEESDRDETMNRLGSIRLGGKIGKGGNLDGGVIPDQAMIDAIREKRERLRQSRAAAPDFIALDGGSNHGEAEGLSDEEPEFQGRIALIEEKGDAKKGVFEDVFDVSNAAFRKENVGNDSDDGVEDEEDEEDKMFLLPSSTATTATAAMSRSRIRNFRRRSEDDDNEDEDKEKTTTPAATTTISKKQQSKPATATPKPKKPSLLSFADDESTDFITPITRSRPSNPFNNLVLPVYQNPHLSKERTSASSLPSNVQPQAGVYTKEALLELQKNTKTLGSSTSRSRPRPLPCEPIIVLKGMVKPIIDDSLTNTKEGDEESDSDETMNRLGSIRLGGKIGKGGNLDGGVIPDQAMIDAIRAKRERLRQSRAAAPDFIALDGGSNHGEVEGLSDEEPEFHGRIALIWEKGDAKKGVFEDVVDVSNATYRKENVGNDSDDGVEDEEDEEDKMWEEEQFRKGLGKRIDEGVAVRGVSSSTIPTIVQNVQKKVAYPTVPVSSNPSVNNGPSIGGSFGWSRFRYNINTSFAKTSVGLVYIVSRFLLPSSTATTATATMSSSRIRNFRRRSEDDDNEDEDKEKTTTPAATTTTISKKQQSKPATATPKPKKPSLLSFADEESTDFITPITRSHPSNPIKQPTKERTSASSLPANVQPQAGVYTKEALLELQKNTKTLGSSTSHSRPRPPPCEPIIVLKGMVKPIIDDSLTNTKEGDEESYGDETMNRLGSIRLGGKIRKGGNLDGGVIPDQAMIDAIRAKRERRRQSRAAAPDFIALGGGSNHGEAEGLSDEEPEFQGRIALIGEKGDAKNGVFEDVVDVSNATFRKENVGNDSDDGVEDEEDEEDKITIPTIVQNVQQKVAYPTVPVSSYPSVNNGPNIGGSFGWSSGSDTISISQQAELSKKALHDSVRRLKETHNRTLTSLTKTDENLADSLTKVTALENAYTAIDEKFRFMQKLHEYVSVICEFLQMLHKKRAEAIFERRAADSKDELMELEPSVNAAMVVINKGGNTNSIVESAGIAAQLAQES